MMGLIFFVVVLVATIVLAILASKVWHWAHVLVIVGLVFATIGYSNCAYRVLAVRSKFQKQEKDRLDRLAERQKLVKAIDSGTADSALVSRLAESLGLDDDATSFISIGDLEHELRMESRVRGRLWDNVRPLGAPDRASLQIEVGVAEDAAPMNIAQNAILYVFEKGDPSQGAAYIGEFRVVQSAQRKLRLEPVLAMHNDDLDRFFRSAADARPWTLHESMPVDTHEMFASLSEEQLRAMLPEATVEEYIRHGGETRPDDPERRVMGIDADGELVGPEDIDRAQKEFYSRKLRDYAYEFQEHAQRQMVLRSEGLAIQSNKQKLDEALAGAKKLGAIRQDEKRRLNKDLSGVIGDQQAAEDHLVAVESRLGHARDLLEKIITANINSADKLAALQSALVGGADLSTTPVPAQPATDSHGL